MDSLALPNFTRRSVSECTAAQQAIDTEIEQIPLGLSSKAHRELCTRRNSYALINAWFPTELMVAIFYEIVITFRVMPYAKKRIKCYDFVQSFTFSYVCQVWRSIAIGTPRLWEAVSLFNSNITAFMLQRSMPSPILISYHSRIPRESINETVPIVQALSHADRAREIDLVMYPSGLRGVVLEHLAKPMPFLKQLKLSIQNATTDGVPCLLPPGCLEGANVLRRLDLRMVGFSPQSVLPTTLTELILDNLPERFSTSQMVALLAPLEALRNLRIAGALRASAPDPLQLPHNPRCPSPRTTLTRFHLDAPARERNEFMSRFRTTSETQITLACHVETLEDFRFGELLRSMYGARGPLRGLSISYTHEVCIRTYMDPSFQIHPSTCINVTVMPSVMRRGFFPWQETLRDLCAIIPLDSVETLVVESFHDNAEFVRANVQLLVPHLRRVRQLEMETDCAKHMLPAIYPQRDGGGPAFPSVSLLTVDEQRSSRKIEKGLMHAIADCLIARKRSGKAADMEELFVNSWRVPPEYLWDSERLRAWDGPVAPRVLSSGITPTT